MKTAPRLVIAASVLALGWFAAGGGTDASASQPLPASAHSTVKAPTKVLVFVEENHSLSQMLAGMPYLSRLATKRYGYAAHYLAITHPSLPNYLAIAGGSTFGVTNDGGPATNAPKVGKARSAFDEAIAHGLTAKTYAESMPSNCYLKTAGEYAPKHNPWTYFASGRRSCNRYDVPMGTPSHGAFAHDIKTGHLPNVGMAIPNLCNDAHSCAIARADHWLKRWLPPILHSHAFTSGRLAVVVTADEGVRSAPNTVLTAVLHAPGRGGRAVRTPLTHYSLSGFLSRMAHAHPLRHAARATSFARAFGL
jgi:acid phosphatase